MEQLACRHPLRWGHRLHVAIDGYAPGIVRLIANSYGRHTIQKAWSEFTGGKSQVFWGNHANTELFFSWLFHRWAPAREKGDELRDEALYGTPPTRAYLDRRSRALNPLLRMYLEACLASFASFYEVLDCEPGEGFHARDVFTDSTYEVSEQLASTSLANGDILYANLIRLEQVALMEAISPLSFPPQSKSHLLELCSQDMAARNSGPQLREIYFRLFDAHHGDGGAGIMGRGDNISERRRRRV
ncbi:MAG TPA: hypothetical protein VI653_09610 [Steroidobacteraceae bacterium]